MALTDINFPNGISSFGVPLLAGTQGRNIYLDPTNGRDDWDGLSVTKAKKTLTNSTSTGAYDIAVENKNDVIHYLAGASGLTLGAKLTWAKSMVHFVGHCAPVSVAQRARIFQLSTATGVSPLVDITGSGCIFQNLYFFQGVNDNTSKICVQVEGSRNYFKNVHFAGIGHATMDVAGAASLAFRAGPAECVFDECSIGLDTIARAQNSVEILFAAGAQASRILFKDCLIYGYISNAGHRLVSIADGTAIDRWIRFKNCLFITDSTNRAVTATETFLTPAGIVQGKVILENCSNLTDGASGSGVWDASGADVIWANMAAPAAAAAGGLMTKL